MVKSMSVLIELFGIQRDTAKIDKINMPITEETRLRDAIDYVKNNFPVLSLDKDSIIVTVNHEFATRDRLLKANDIIFILPFIGGG